ncbi:PIN domain-containing protein [Candidatus Pacearchaeota archaeon]|nr:PIN domain-containing protein [Candidatus Pacearchaeota archaeon]
MKQEENFITINNHLFFDTYAIFEIIKGNPNYKKYTSFKVITTKLNLFELFHGFLKTHNNGLAEYSLANYLRFAVDFDERVIREAARMKLALNKRNISMTDCIGYCFAKQLGIKFLTGDREFESLPNVEFVR